MMKRVVMISMVLLVAVTMGCSSMSTTQKWMAGGAGAGAALGGLWGSSGGGLLNAGEGAAVGAVTGATVGGLVGDQQEIQDEWVKLADENKKLAADNGDLQEEKRALMTEKQALENDLDVANRRIETLEGQVANLTDELAKCKGSRLELTLSTDLLFEPGSNRLSAAGKKALDEAAAKVKEVYADKFITVEGHTDVDPIKQSSWKDNWELGSARSLAVLRYLIDKGVDPAKSSAATYSKYQPIAEGDSKEAKAKNRRAVIVIHTGWPRF